MNHLSDRINKISTSQTLAMAALARELKAQGKDIISLSLGEPDFNTPDFIKEAAKKAIDENYSTYSPVDGYMDLKQAICKKFKRDNDLDYKPEQIVVSNGAKQTVYNLCQALLDPVGPFDRHQDEADRECEVPDPRPAPCQKDRVKCESDHRQRQRPRQQRPVLIDFV